MEKLVHGYFDISNLIPMQWYWCMNRGVWRGPMQFMNPEFCKDDHEIGFWFPEWEGEFKKTNFFILHIDSDSVKYGVRHIIEPNPY